MGDDWTPEDLDAFAEALIEGRRDEFAGLARDYYTSYGRGAIVVTVPGPRPKRGDDPREVQIGYRPLEEYRRRTRPLVSGPSSRDIECTIAEIQTYDVFHEVPLSIIAGPTFLTLAFVLLFEDPNLVPQAHGVH